MDWAKAGHTALTILIPVALVALTFFLYDLWERRHGHDSMHKPKDNAESPRTPVVGLANPMRAVESVGDINSAVGCNIHAPEGAEDEKFFVFRIDPPLGDYRFTLNGRHYCLRASRTEDDITGVYVSNGTLTEAAGASREIGPVMIEGNCFTRFFRGDMQYALTSSDAELGEFGRTAKSLANDI